MARGKKSLIETTNLPIEKTDKEEGQIPYFIIDDEWGVSCDDRNEILVHKRLANRTIKDENNINTYIEQYYSWESICYTSNFTTAIDIYANKKEQFFTLLYFIIHLIFARWFIGYSHFY